MAPVLVRCRPVQPVTWSPLEGCPALPLVCRCPVAAFSAHEPYLYSLLHTDEKDRANRYYQPGDRLRFVIARGLLRILLSRYAARPPQTLAFVTDAHKKPRLADFPALHFNVSHAGDWIVTAVALTPVGVDVEPINPAFDFASVMAHLFSPGEQVTFADAGTVRSRFYERWTRREALAKATGKGIDDDFYRLPSLEGDHWVNHSINNTAVNWTVSSFVVADEYRGAVACQTIPGAPEPTFVTIDERLLVGVSF